MSGDRPKRPLSAYMLWLNETHLKSTTINKKLNICKPFLCNYIMHLFSMSSFYLKFIIQIFFSTLFSYFNIVRVVSFTCIQLFRVVLTLFKSCYAKLKMFSPCLREKTEAHSAEQQIQMYLPNRICTYTDGKWFSLSIF